MTFDELLDKLWFFDYEVYAHDVLMVAKSYRDRKEVVFHNSCPYDYEQFINKYQPILCGYNSSGYDKYILKACLLGYTPEECRVISDYIVEGNQGWEYEWSGYCDLPVVWDLMQFLKSFKSLKEIEGNLRLDITETTIEFDSKDKWNQKEFEEVLYYCRHDVDALFPLFDFYIKSYKSRYIVCKFGGLYFEQGLASTDANLTATLLGAKKVEHDDNFAYEYPSCVQKEKIPKKVLDYIDDLIEHNDIDYKPKAPFVKIGKTIVQLGVGGTHGFLEEGTVYYDRGDKLQCE